jgi:hypothetical protein
LERLRGFEELLGLVELAVLNKFARACLDLIPLGPDCGTFLPRVNLREFLLRPVGDVGDAEGIGWLEGRPCFRVVLCSDGPVEPLPDGRGSDELRAPLVGQVGDLLAELGRLVRGGRTLGGEGADEHEGISKAAPGRQIGDPGSKVGSFTLNVVCRLIRLLGWLLDDDGGLLPSWLGDRLVAALVVGGDGPTTEPRPSGSGQAATC